MRDNHSHGRFFVFVFDSTTLFFEPLQIGSRHIELYARPAEVPPRTPQMALVFVEARPQAAIAPQFGSIETPPDGQDSLFTLLRPLR